MRFNVAKRMHMSVRHGNMATLLQGDPYADSVMSEMAVQHPHSTPPQGHGVVADLFKIDEVEAGVKEAIEKMGGLDILVNNGA